MSKETVLTLVLGIFYLVGLVGISLYPKTFSQLSPMNLLLSLAICFWLHTPKNSFFYVQLLIVFLASFILEYTGVNTGVIFGNYAYGDHLGPKLGNTPLLIGVNWILVSYGSLQVVSEISKRLNKKVPALLGAFLAALLMVLLDALIEPIAPTLNFWEFAHNQVPIQNYTAWFFFGFVFCYWLIQGNMVVNNPMGWKIYVAQFIFFALLNFTL